VLAYASRGDRQSALFVLLCVVTFLPAVAGWHVLVPALGSVVLLAANAVYRPWRRVFVPYTSVLVIVSVVITVVGVAMFQLISSRVRASEGTLVWSVLPGQEYGLFVVIVIVVIASITNATFEELLWRVGLPRLFPERVHTVVQWLVLSIVFGLSHINGTPGGTVGMVFAGLFGFAMCVIRRLSRGTVLWIVVAHFVADVILIGAVYGFLS